jgi:UDP-N-acetylglucosamine--N-acetylmuramyl-(pentapeptide) pyrophosphoryl-undecaprenol N-acetylglucosamine transferase
VFTTGGYVSIPVLLAARAQGIPVLLWEGNVVPGRSVRATARLASAVAVSFPETCAALRASRCYVTGTPIRDLAGADRGAARETLGIPADGRVILVFGGSQAVRRLNDAVAEALSALVQDRYVIHVTGDAGYAAALAARQQLPEGLRPRYRPERFLREGMVAALAATDLVVGRAGSSTLAEVTALGLPMVVVPYPHAGGHQRANAEAMAAAGAGRIVADEAFDAAALLAASAILDDAVAYEAMAAAARDLGRPFAADAVAELLLALATRAALPDSDAVAAWSRGPLA